MNNKYPYISFPKYYSLTTRIFFHLTAWSLFFIFMFLNYHLNINIHLLTSLFLSFRILISTLLTFYFISFFISFTIKRFSFTYIIFCIFILSIIIWLTINKICYSLGYLINVNYSELHRFLGKSPNPTFSELYSFKYILLNIPSVIFSLSPFLFLKIISILIGIYNENINYEKEQKLLILEKNNFEKQFLLAQLNPHFLFNTLTNIYGLILNRDTYAAQAVINLSDIMRYTLYENEKNKVLLSKELDFITKFFEINKLRYSNKHYINLSIKINQDITLLKIAPLISFVLIENAFKYGLKSPKKFLICNIIIENDVFNLSIENDSTDSLNPSVGGIGLKNIKNRLEIIYPSSYNFQYYKSKNSYKVILNINLNEKKTN